MPSIRVKKGYHNLDYVSPDDRLRSRSLSAQPAPAPPSQDEYEMSPNMTKANTWAHRPTSSTTGRPRAASRVSNHIMSSVKLKQAPAPPVSDTPMAGPSRSAQDNRGMTHFFLRHGRHPDSYMVEGQQAELRVPNDGHRDLEGSQVNLALRQLEDEFDQPDSLDEHHHDDIVEHLDVIDPQISTVCTLTNAANAMVVPPLSFYSRKPVIVLPRPPKKAKKPEDAEKELDSENASEDALDQHVQDVLSKRDQFRRAMQGVWSFLKTPLGIVTAIYGFLVVFWGCGIVLFLAKIINVHNPIQQGFWVELCQQVETGLFTVTSIGFIPFRIMDTYRICKIWRYKRKIAWVRRRAGLLELYDPDDLPDPVYDKNYVQVLAEKEQIDLHYQQHQFMKSQTWYRPHGTPTHRAFPINLALWICVCNDLNSVFQCLLSGTMWGLDRFQRPAWTTATSLPAAFVAGIIAGVLIYVGARKTRRHEQVEDRLRLALDMEQDATRAKHSSSDTPTITVEEAGPQGLLRAETSSKPGSSAVSDTNLAPDVLMQSGRDARPAHTLGGRKRSAGSLRFTDEMVVPRADTLHPL